MFPGLVSKISESAVPLTTSIAPQTDLVRISNTTSTTVLATIVPPYAGFSGVMFVHNSSGGNITTVTTSNILTAVTIGSNALVLFVYNKVLDKWIVGALA